MEFKIRNAVIPIIAVNLAFFLIQFVYEPFTNLFVLDSELVFSRPWTIVTSMFLHSTHSINHLVFNMLALVVMGALLEENIGAKRFLILYFASGILASILSIFFYHYVFGEHLRALGASGAIMGIIGALMIIKPHQQLLIWGIVPMPIYLIGIMYIVFDIFGILFPSNVGNIAHLSGVALGLCYGVYLKKSSAKFHKKFSKKKHLDEVDMDEYLKSGRI